MRLSYDRGKNYPRKWERNLPNQLPGVPAAVPVYSTAGDAALVVVDLDISRGGAAAVQRDRDQVLAWLARHGARAIVDHSPTGGVHIYLPLAEPVPFGDARAFAEALAARTPTMDALPHANVTDGCIRPPGSPHKAGGHQVLDTPLTTAYDILRRPNGPTAWAALSADLAEEITAAHARRAQRGGPVADDLAAAPSLPRPAGPRQLPPGAHQIAVSGDYDTTRYASPSEARQAVLVAAAAAGWQLIDVVRRMETGLWPGLASFYARYRSGYRRTAAVKDWRRAVAYVGREHDRSDKRGESVRKSSTSEPPTQAGALRAPPAANAHQRIRAWRNALASLEKNRYTGRPGLVRRLILRALAEAAHKTGATTIEMGVRSLAIATGQHHTTVAAHLRVLRAEPDPFLTLIEEGRGTHGDLYELRIPDAAAGYATTAAWRPGKAHALRPAFRELGTVAAHTYEAIETAPEPLHTLALAKTTGIARSAVTTALDALAAWGLIERHHGRWHLRRAGCLHAAAEALGTLEAVAIQLTGYRRERAAWRAWLSRHTPHPHVVLHDVEHPWPPWPPEPPPEDQHTTLYDLLHRELGATPVHTAP